MSKINKLAKYAGIDASSINDVVALIASMFGYSIAVIEDAVVGGQFYWQVIPAIPGSVNTPRFSDKDTALEKAVEMVLGYIKKEKLPSAVPNIDIELPLGIKRLLESIYWAGESPRLNDLIKWLSSRYAVELLVFAKADDPELFHFRFRHNNHEYEEFTSTEYSPDIESVFINGVRSAILSLSLKIKLEKIHDFQIEARDKNIYGNKKPLEPGGDNVPYIKKVEIGSERKLMELLPKLGYTGEFSSMAILEWVESMGYSIDVFWDTSSRREVITKTPPPSFSGSPCAWYQPQYFYFCTKLGDGGYSFYNPERGPGIEVAFVNGVYRICQEIIKNNKHEK